MSDLTSKSIIVYLWDDILDHLFGKEGDFNYTFDGFGYGDADFTIMNKMAIIDELKSVFLDPEEEQQKEKIINLLIDLPANALICFGAFEVFWGI